MLGNIVYTPAPAAAVATSLTIGTTPIVGGTAGAVLFESTLNKVSENAGLNYTAGGVLTITSITQQLKVAYNAGNRLDLTVGSTGNATFALTGTTPTFIFSQAASIATSLTTPLLIGGTTTTSPLTFKTTTGVGTTGADIIFKVGNNGATEAMRILNSGNVGLGIVSPQNKLHVYSTAVADGISIDGSLFPSLVLRANGVIIGYSPAIVTANAGFFTDSLTGDMAYRNESKKILFGVGSTVSTMAVSATGLSIGTILSSAKLHVISTTEQFRTGYDSTHFASFTCNSTGALTITLTGTALSTFFTDKVVLGNTITLAPYTFATLPAAPLAGQKAYIIDALAPVYLAPAVGGGLIFCPVFYNGVNWVTC